MGDVEWGEAYLVGAEIQRGHHHLRERKEEAQQMARKPSWLTAGAGDRETLGRDTGAEGNHTSIRPYEYTPQYLRGRRRNQSRLDAHANMVPKLKFCAYAQHDDA